MRDESMGKLAGLVDEAAKELLQFDRPLLAIASAAHKYNDAMYDDYWCAVQLGSHLWEQS